MSKRILTLLILLVLQFTIYRTMAAIGNWKAYMAYHEVQEIEEAGNLVFVQASNDLYVYNKNDQSIQTFSKVDYLNDCDIQHIAYNKSANRLIILYNNSNIDLMDIKNYEVTNLPDYADGSISGDKTVNDIYMYGAYAYLSTNFGIVKLNVKEAEISDTYNLGFKVDWCEIKGQNIYAYSSTHGQYHALLTDNLLDPKTWDKIGGYVAKTVEDKSELKQLVSTLNPGGPKYNYFWFMKFTNNQLYTCGGGFGHLTETNRPGTIQVLNDDNWQIYQDEDISNKTGLTYVDINTLDIDPLDGAHVFAGARNGLYEFKNGKFVKHYNSENSLIASNNGSKNYEIIGSTLFDKEGNLWITNNQTTDNPNHQLQSLIEYTKDGSWVSHHNSELYDENYKFSLGSMENLMFDSRGLLWFGNSYFSKPYLFCYQPSTKTLLPYKSFINQDGTDITPTAIQAIAEDNNHNMWIGTPSHVFLIESKDIGKENPTVTQIKVPRNDGTNNADYLLEDVNISTIIVDKLNRKWFGTKGNGVFLIGSDNITTIHHFTESNSKLLSNNIESIAMNDATGEIFFGTDKGLCSYQSDTNSVNEEMTKDNVWAYPNPVRPDYTGLITITGLSIDADVKIVSSNGSLIHQGRSSGGTYTWDGCDLKGKKVASGVYMVETAKSDGSKGTVCKIAIIR